MKDHSNENGSELATAKESTTITCSEKGLKGNQRSGKAYREKKGSRYALVGRFWQGEVENGLTEAGILCEWFGNTVGFSWLFLSWKWGPKNRGLAVQILTILGQLLQKTWFGFLDWL